MPGLDPREIEWMSAAKVAKTYGVTVSTVYYWAEGGCPCRRVKGELQFQLKAVIEWRRNSGQ